MTEDVISSFEAQLRIKQVDVSMDALDDLKDHDTTDPLHSWIRIN
jgi:hypothetical protein